MNLLSWRRRSGKTNYLTGLLHANPHLICIVATEREADFFIRSYRTRWHEDLSTDRVLPVRRAMEIRGYPRTTEFVIDNLESVLAVLFPAPVNTATGTMTLVPHPERSFLDGEWLR